MNDEPCPGLGHHDCAAAVSLSVAFEVLADERRRHLLSYLADRNGPVPFSKLAGAVIERSIDAAGGTADVSFLGEEYRRITLSIEREHLPLLERHGVVAYDRELGLIELAPDLHPLDHLLEMARRSDE